MHGWNMYYVLRNFWLSMRTAVKNIGFNAAKSGRGRRCSVPVGDLPLRPGCAVTHITHVPNIADIGPRTK